MTHSTECIIIQLRRLSITNGGGREGPLHGHATQRSVYVMCSAIVIYWFSSSGWNHALCDVRNIRLMQGAKSLVFCFVLFWFVLFWFFFFSVLCLLSLLSSLVRTWEVAALFGLRRQRAPRSTFICWEGDRLTWILADIHVFSNSVYTFLHSFSCSCAVCTGLSSSIHLLSVYMVVAQNTKNCLTIYTATRSSSIIHYRSRSTCK